jgi:hypothetical protein
MVAASYSHQMSVSIYQTACCYIPEDGSLQIHCSENINMSGIMNVYRVLVENLKRPPGRSRQRLNNNIKMNIKTGLEDVDWIHLSL